MVVSQYAIAALLDNQILTCEQEGRAMPDSFEDQFLELWVKSGID